MLSKVGNIIKLPEIENILSKSGMNEILDTEKFSGILNNLVTNILKTTGLDEIKRTDSDIEVKIPEGFEEKHVEINHGHGSINIYGEKNTIGKNTGKRRCKVFDYTLNLDREVESHVFENGKVKIKLH